MTPQSATESQIVNCRKADEVFAEHGTRTSTSGGSRRVSTIGPTIYRDPLLASELIAAAALKLPGMRLPVPGAMNEKQVIIVGSLARDRIEAGGSVHHRVGGAVWYAGTTFANLGIKTCVVTRTAATDKDLVQAVRDAGVEVKWRPSTRTTTFVNRYFADNPDGRMQNVTALAEPIEAEQLLEALVGVHVVYLGPLHAEDVADDTLQALRIHRPPLIALDAQGYTRAVRAGRVIPKLDHRLHDILNFCDVVKANQEELRIISGVRELPEAALSLATSYPDLEIVVTCGTKGAYVVQRDEVHYEPAVPVDISDSTGAGDVYFASYLAKRYFAKRPGEASIEKAAEFAANYSSGYLADRATRLNSC